MPLNLSALGARELIDALTNPATAPRVAVAVRNAGVSVAESFVVATSRTGSELRVRGYSAAHATPFSVDAFVLEYGPFSVRAGLAQSDVSFLPAAVGVYFELLFALAESASPPAVAAPGISAQEVLEASSAAIAAKDAAILARNEAVSAAHDAADLAANEAAAAVLSKSVRVDVPQSHTPAEQAQGRANLGIGQPGGVALAGDAGAAAGFGYPSSIPLSPEFEVIVSCRRNPVDARRRAVVAFTHSGGQATLSFGHPFGGSEEVYVGISDIYDLPAIPLSDNSIKTIGFGRDAVGWFVWCNGQLTRITGLTTEIPVSVDRVCGGVFGGYGQFCGDVKAVRIVNRPLSGSERAAVMREEWPAALAHRGVELTTTGWSAAYDYVLSSVTANGFTCAYAGASFSFASPSAPMIPSMFRANRPLRITCDVTLNSGSASNLPGMALFNGESFQANTPLPLVVGRNELLVPDGPGTDTYLIFSNHPGVWGNSGACNYTVSNIRMEELGTVARHEPDQVTSIGSWFDSSGNGRHLVPTGNNRGVTPLNPQPKRTRHMRWLLNFAAPGTATVKGSGPHALITFGDQYTATVWWPGWFNAEMKASATFQMTSGAAGQGTFAMNGVAQPVSDYSILQIEAAAKLVAVDMSFEE